ncbi:MAG: family 78 glycoside hydrolase catalytic domain [Bacteroidales bacterium]
MKKTGLLLLVLCLSISSLSGQLLPGSLRCEYLENPPVVDVPRPRLSWVNQASPGDRMQEQTAWEIRVASSPDRMEDADVWASGKVSGEDCLRVPYGGRSLSTGESCFWQVRVWDRDDRVSPWSEVARWRMGILGEDEWTARWIGAPWQGEEALPKPSGGPAARPAEFGPPAPLLRKEFKVEKEVAEAVAFVTGLGYFELYLDGRKVGEDVLVPNQTNYGKRPGLENALIFLPDAFREYRVMYLAYDLTGELNPGSHALGAMLGNGFYNPAKFWAEGYGSPRFLCQVRIRYTDGSEEVIASDESWTAGRGPVVMDMVYYGETYDAREEQAGWNQPGFDDSAWQPVALREAPAGSLVAHTAEPDRVMEELLPVTIDSLGPGHYRVDFGEEISGWVRLRGVDGPAGHEIRIRFDGNEYSGDNLYVCSGRGPADYAPRFNWFVFRSVEITNWPGALRPGQLSAEAVYTRIRPSAVFASSNPLFNQINTIWRRSQTDNMHGGVASDCPHRERSPYTGDGQVASLMVMHNYDARNFYHKWVQDMLGSQNPETGYVPNGSPWQPGCGGGPAWGAAICIIPWHFYVQYGSLDMLEDNFDGMTGYVRYMLTWTGEDGIMHSQRQGKDGSVLQWFNLGEWVAPGNTVPDALVHTFYLWYCADICANVAGILGRDDEAREYAGLADRTREAFHARFYDPVGSTYGNGGGNILALRMGVPPERRDRVIASLRANLQSNGGHLDTGIFGTRFFFEVLSENGMTGEAYAALNKTTEPGFGRWIELGSTTTRERWDEGGSHNHPMFGGGLVWLYRNLAGMQADPAQPGYRHIHFEPQLVDSLDYVHYGLDTPYGPAGIQWKLDHAHAYIDVRVPVGCTATLCLPVTDPAMVREQGLPLKDTEGVRVEGMEEGRLRLTVESGGYYFQIPGQGIHTVKVEPFPGSLFALILPPSFRAMS